MHLGKAGSCRHQARTHAVQGQLWRVVGFAEVGQPEPANAVAAPGAEDGVGGLVVGEVTGGTENALFEVVGIGTAHEPLAVVIGLQDEHVGLEHGLEHGIGDFTTVNGDADAATTGAQ